MILEHLLAASAATDALKHDIQRYRTCGRAGRIAVSRSAPPIKVLRVLAQLLSHHPELAIDTVRIEASSGCADFVGVVDVETARARHRFEFVWDCAWRAVEQGWTDCFGFPDQIRAAREFDWRCFRTWREVAAPSDSRRFALAGD